MSKRALLASAMEWFGLTRLLEIAGSKPGILVINHHRIGDAQATRFDRGVFSATVEQLDRQVRYIKSRFPVLGGEELASLTFSAPLQRFYVAFTFDDGYLDNYTHAFDVLRANDCCATFFLVPSYVGSNTIPWWDAIAFLVRNSMASRITLELPKPLTVDLEPDREAAIQRVLNHYKLPENTDTNSFMEQLKQATGAELPHVGRRFLDWAEAAEMQSAGMTIGSHTLTHRILGQLSDDEQRHELEQSRAQLREKLGTTITTLAYPVGIPTAFSSTTEAVAIDAGYTACFSFYGGVNAGPNIRATNLLRNELQADPLLFRNQVAWIARFGRLPY